jgi:hypothetical protein
MLAKHDRVALLGVIGELYALNAQNRDFLEARFIPSDIALNRYKKVIYEALYPDVMSSDPVNFREARKVIADYKKALGEPRGLAELTVYAAECGNQFTCDYGDIDGAFYDSLIRMFGSAAKIISMLDAKEAKPFIVRLRVIVEKAEGIGWGYFDSISDIFSGSFPNAN